MYIYTYYQPKCYPPQTICYQDNIQILEYVKVEAIPVGVKNCGPVEPLTAHIAQWEHRPATCYNQQQDADMMGHPTYSAYWGRSWQGVSALHGGVTHAIFYALLGGVTH